MTKGPGVVLSVHCCAKCGGELTSRSYEQWLTASYESCECSSCGLMWQIVQFSSGKVRIAEVPSDEDSPDEMVSME